MQGAVFCVCVAQSGSCVFVQAYEIEKILPENVTKGAVFGIYI